MDFEFTADQELLRDTVRRFLADQAPTRRTCGPSSTTTAPAAAGVWTGLADLGVTGLLVPEAHGGAGAGMVDAAVVLEELGRAVYPGPYASTRGRRRRPRRPGRRRRRPRRAPPRARHGRRGSARSHSSPACGRDGDAGRRIAVASPASSTGEGHVPDALAADVLVLPAACPTTVRASSSSTPAAGGATVATTPTVDGTRKHGSVSLAAAPGRRLGRRRPDGGTRRDGRPARSPRRWSTVSGPRPRALEMAVEYAQGASPVRPADRRLPGGAAPLRRHAADRRAGARRRRTTPAGPPTRPTPPNATGPRPWPSRSPPTSSYGVGASRRSRCTAASASPGSTTSTCSTSGS